MRRTIVAGVRSNSTASVLHTAIDRAPLRRKSEVLSIPDGASESKKSVEFKTPFAPAIIKVDPDVRMLQLRRKLAEWKPKWRRAALPLNPRASSIVATLPK